jgi:hypothetical protein
MTGAAVASSNAPATTAARPVALAMRSPSGARRSTVIATVTIAIADRSITPMTSKMATNPAQQ